jgi:uncharacterized protein
MTAVDSPVCSIAEAESEAHREGPLAEIRTIHLLILIAAAAAVLSCTGSPATVSGKQALVGLITAREAGDCDVALAAWPGGPASSGTGPIRGGSGAASSVIMSYPARDETRSPASRIPPWQRRSRASHLAHERPTPSPTGSPLPRVLPALREKFPISRIALFGSHARGEQRADSDADILVEVDPSIGLRFSALAEKLERLLEEPVELVSSRAISPSVRPLVEADCIGVA